MLLHILRCKIICNHYIIYSYRNNQYGEKEERKRLPSPTSRRNIPAEETAASLQKSIKSAHSDVLDIQHDIDNLEKERTRVNSEILKLEQEKKDIEKNNTSSSYRAISPRRAPSIIPERLSELQTSLAEIETQLSDLRSKLETKKGDRGDNSVWLNNIFMRYFRGENKGGKSKKRTCKRKRTNKRK